jgi:intracellular multiplication protein IcmE
MLSAERFVPRFVTKGIFNSAGRAGPRRLLGAAVVALAMVGTVTGIMVVRYQEPATSKVTRMPGVNPLPGGLNSNPEQAALALQTAQERAQSAAASGQSYTPPLNASSTLLAPVVDDQSLADDGTSTTKNGPRVAKPAPPVRVPAEPLQLHTSATGGVAESASPRNIQKASLPDDPPTPQAVHAAIENVLKGWGGQVPRTDIVIPATASEDETPVAGKAQSAHRDATPPPGKEDGAENHETGKLLVPTGRYVFAHTILSVNSDTGGPIVMEADSGPIRGDRMIASFTKNGYDRLVVRVTAVIHHGHELEANGLAIAPDSLETSVASSVDEHFLQRFALPAAAAFVQGLGQAISTSNTTSTVSPLTGSVVGQTKLNLGQQLGVAAGTSAQQVGSALAQEAPKGPTINLAANVNLGVMFLANLREAAE